MIVAYFAGLRDTPTDATLGKNSMMCFQPKTLGRGFLLIGVLPAALALANAKLSVCTRQVRGAGVVNGPPAPSSRHDQSDAGSATSHRPWLLGGDANTLRPFTSLAALPTIGIGVKLSGGGAGLPFDYGSLNNAGIWVYQDLVHKGSDSIGSANQWTSYLYGYMPPTGSSSGYEKGTLQVASRCADPSSYGVISRDCVGIDVSAVIASTNHSGSSSALNSKLIIDGEGHGSAAEFDVFNNTAFGSGDYGSASAKVGLGIFAYGQSPSTSAVIIDSGSRGVFYQGIEVVGTSLKQNALLLRSKRGGRETFKIDKDGRLFAKSLASEDGLLRSVDSNVSCSGPSQADASPLVKDLNVAVGGRPGLGVVLAPIIGRDQILFVRTQSCFVWPPKGARIDIAGRLLNVNQPIAIKYGDNAKFVCVSNSLCMYIQ